MRFREVGRQKRKKEWEVIWGLRKDRQIKMYFDFPKEREREWEMLGKPTIYNKNNNMYFLEIISNIIKKTELKLKKGGRDRMYLLFTKGRLRSVCDSNTSLLGRKGGNLIND